MRLAALLVVLFVLASASGASLPILQATGSHYDVGKAVGEAFSDRIKGWIANYDNLNQVLLPYYATSAGKEALSSLLHVNRAAFPRVWDEIQGIIDGSGASEVAIQLLIFEDEMSALAPSSSRPGPFEHCTDILLSNATTMEGLIGHNEDADPLTSQYAYMLNATYVENGEVVARIFAFCYPGTPPGEAWGFSSRQLVFSQNAVFPQQVSVKGLSNLFVARTIYDCPTLQCVLQFYQSHTNYALGLSMNIGSYATTTPQLYNIEIAPGARSILPISGNYTHVNIYQHLAVPQYPDPSSSHRLATSYSHPAVTNASSILALLGNNVDPQYPIYRTGAPPDCCATVTTSLFDLIGRSLTYFYASNPASSSPVEVINLP